MAGNMWAATKKCVVNRHHVKITPITGKQNARHMIHLIGARIYPSSPITDGHKLSVLEVGLYDCIQRMDVM